MFNFSFDGASTDDPQAPGWTCALPTVIDLEASGFGAGSYPIEVGFVLPSGRRAYWLIRPQPEWTHWSDEAERLHGLSRAQLLTQGQHPRAVCMGLNEALAGLTVYSDAWHRDWPWTALLFDAAGCRPSFRMEALQKLFDEQDFDRWNTVLHQARQRSQLPQRHCASIDALVLQAAFADLKGYRKILRAA